MNGHGPREKSGATSRTGELSPVSERCRVFDLVKTSRSAISGLKSNVFGIWMTIFCKVSGAILGCVMATSVAAETLEFQLRGFGGSIGAMKVTTGSVNAVDAITDGMPLDTFNGTFKAERRGDAYVADRLGKNGNRRLIQIGFKGRDVADVSVDPAEDQTDLSIATAVDEPVESPMEVLAAAMSAEICGKSHTFYDGRRIVDLKMQGAAKEGEEGFVCTGAYHIRRGPGHGSILNIRNLPITLHFPSATAPVSKIETRLMGFGLSAERS